MKNFFKNKNVFLFLSLVVLLTATYWFEERGKILSDASESERTMILNTADFGKMKGFEGIKLNVEKKGEKYFSRENQLPMSEARLNEFFKILSGLKIKTFLKDEDVARVGRAFYIPDEALKLNFQFEKGDLSFSLGKKLSYDQTFYMEITEAGKKRIVIVSDESPDPGVYKTDQEYQRSEAKYKRLEIVFMLTNNYFYDARVFKDLYLDDKSIHFNTVSIATFRNKKFSIDFKSTMTTPPAPHGINAFEENWISFHQSLSHLEARNLYAPYEKNALSEILSHFEIDDRDGRHIVLDVYKKFGELNGYFLTSSLDKTLYVLKPEDARLFFINVQDFWKKRLAPSLKEYKLGLTFFNSKLDEVNISDGELFKVTSNQSKISVKSLEFKKLIDFIKSEGDHLSELTEKPSEILKKQVLQLSFENRSLSVILEDNDAVVVDLNLKVKIHHYVGANLPFSIKRADYFEGIK